MTGGGRADAVADARADELERVLQALRVGDVKPRLLDVTQADARTACRVLDAKYSPGRACTVLYSVGDRLVSGEVELNGSGPGEGPVPVRLTVFPDDPGLPALRALLDPVQASSVLADLALAGDGRVLTCSATLLRYRAGRRATLRLSGRVRDASGALRQVAYVVKIYHDQAKAGAVAAESARLERSRPVRAGVVGVAPFVAFLPALPAVAWSVVDGLALDLVLAGRGGGQRAGVAVRRAGCGLAGLHAAAGVSDRRRPAGEELAKYLGRATRVAAVAPDLGARLLAVLDGLSARRDVLAAAPEALVHGDCKPSQFLVGEKGVTVLDLDSCRRGDPASDLGAFLATLRQHDVRAAQGEAGDRPLAPHLATRFLEGYCVTAGTAAADIEGLRARAAWFEALALQRKALRAFARSPLSPLPLALVAAAEDVLAAGERGRS